MASTIKNQLVSLLRRNETSWPNPAESIGTFHRQMGGNYCWEAVGPAREAFNQIAEEIKSHLEKSSDPLSHTVTWTVYMIGRTKNRARPTIMFCCQVPGPRKSIRKMIDECNILDKYPGIITGDSNRPPDFDQLVQLAGTEAIGQSYLSMTEMKKCVLYEPSMDVCGVPMYIKDDNDPLKPFRKATIGGVLRAGPKHYCLTVGHAFTDEIPFSNGDSEAESEFEFDVDGQSDIDEDDVDMVAAMSRGSQSPDNAASPNSHSSRYSAESSGDSSSHSVQTFHRSSFMECTHTASYTSVAELQSSNKLESEATRNRIPENLRDIGIFSVLLSLNGSRPGLDYALIETDQPEFDSFNRLNSMGSSRQYLLDPERIVSTRPGNNMKVLAATAFNGVMEGTISGTPTFMKIPSSTTFQEVWTVRLSGTVTIGDCGSWVVNLESGDVYGHIIAGSPRSGVVYIVPAYEILKDLRARSGLPLSLSVRNHGKNHGSSSNTPAEDSRDTDSIYDMSTSGPKHNSYQWQLSRGLESHKNSLSTGSLSSYDSLWSFGGIESSSSVATSHPSSTSPERDSLSNQTKTSYPSPEPTVPSSKEPFLFDIERYGDPRISWVLYYDFKVTKAEAYWQLQPGYLPTEKYPSRVLSEASTRNGKKIHPCHWLGCRSDPFTRHYDLERHYKIHQGATDQFNCDYKRCLHSEPFRKDRCRQHYREYHFEDLLKKDLLKQSDPKLSQRQDYTADEYLSAPINHIDLSYWRCSKCLQRVLVNNDGYTCPNCKRDCEPVRVSLRKKALESAVSLQAEGK